MCTRCCRSYWKRSPLADNLVTVIPLAINLVALIIVLGLCWGAMMWLGSAPHGHGHAQSRAKPEPSLSDRVVIDYIAGDHALNDGAAGDNASSDASANDHVIDDRLVADLSTGVPCATCEGVGAHHLRGKLAPCPECLGTGVFSA